MLTVRDHRGGDLFDPWEYLGPQRRRLLQQSWAGVFRDYLLQHLPVKDLAACFRDDFGRLSKDLLSNDGTILTTYSHRDLVFPNGIDAARSGDVYIANSSNYGAGRRIYRFQRNGKFVSSYPLTQPGHITKLEIDEARDRLYISGTLDDSVYVYDISTGDPVLSRKLQALFGIRGITVESTTGRLFGTSGTDVIEIALDSSGVTSFAKGLTTLSAISIVAVPEPIGPNMALSLLPTLCWFRRLRKTPREIR